MSFSSAIIQSHLNFFELIWANSLSLVILFHVGPTYFSDNSINRSISRIILRKFTKRFKCAQMFWYSAKDKFNVRKLDT